MCASYNPTYKNDDIYSLNFAIPGRVFIFNNRNFTNGAKVRGGSEKDVQRLWDLFEEKIHFEVEALIDKTADQLRNHIRKISKLDFENVGCLLIVIMSHGTDGKILGTDGEEVHLSDFIDPFKTVISLKDKPKMFFVNACRGDKMTPAHDFAKEVEMDKDEANHDLYMASKTPLEADILLAFSTVANYFSIRDSEDGSWFIQVLCDVIEELKTERDVLGILTKVNYSVKNKEGVNKKGKLIKMQSTFTSQLNKMFYFSEHLLVNNIFLYLKI